jgi:hypothetical protein
LLLILRTLAAALFAAALCGCWQSTTREVLSSVLLVDGETTLDPHSGGNLVALARNLHPGPGDAVETKGASRAGLALLPSVLVELGPATRIKIKRLELSKDGNETGSNIRGRLAEIELSKGRIVVSHAWGEALARFSLMTPEGEVTTPSNALFVVDAKPERTRITCASGWLEFRPVGTTSAARIPPGSTAEWSGTALKVTPAETDPVAQQMLQQAMESEQLLRKLLVQQGHAPPR